MFEWFRIAGASCYNRDQGSGISWQFRYKCIHEYQWCRIRNIMNIVLEVFTEGLIRVL